MRLHRLHLSSRHWPRTFAMSWPHSHRVSAPTIDSLDGRDMEECFMILRTIIKIVGSIGDRIPPVKGSSTRQGRILHAVRCRIISRMVMQRLLRWSCAAAFLLLQGCVKELPAVPEEGILHSNVAVGRVVAVLTGEGRRIYEPAVRSFEVQNLSTKERVTVEVESNDERFIVPLAPGDYELIRVQINEGPFLSMAQLGSFFSVGQDPVTYVGTWRFGVDSPKYGRMVSVSMISDEEDRAQALDTLASRDPSLDARAVTTVLPDPAEQQARLYEVMPYPRVSRYFRRHWW